MNVRVKLVGTVVVGVALVVPVAQAQGPDDRAGLRGPGGIAALQADSSSHPDNSGEPRGPGAVAAQQSPAAAVLRPDDRGGARGPGAYAPARSVAVDHPDDRAGPRGPGALTPTVLVTSSSNGFDWRDGLIGGVGGIGAALLVGGAFFLFATQRSRTRIA